jgi:hypothetical protein
MGLIGTNYRIRVLSLLFLVLFLVSTTALVLIIALTQLQPSSPGFTIPADSNAYVFMKFDNGHNRIMVASVAGISLSIASELVGTVFGVFLLKKQIRDQ